MQVVPTAQALSVGAFLFATLVIVFNAYVLDHQYRSPSLTSGTAPAAYDRIRLLTLNMYMRPPLIHSHTTDYKDARLDYLIETVLPHYDVITLQEMFAFASTRRGRLIRAAEEQGFRFWIASPSKSLWDLSIDGGLLILSRYPIVERDSIRYTRGQHSDWLAAKGVLYAKIAVNPDSHLHIFTTHTQASYGRVTPIDDASVLIRFDQFAHLSEFMRNKVASRLPGEPVVVQGDFNVDARVHDDGESEDLHDKRSSEEYREAVSILEGRGRLNHTAAATHPLPLTDLVYQRVGYHPITFGDVLDLPDGKRVPRDTVLTGNDMLSSCQRLDYIFWADPLAYPEDYEGNARFTLQPVNATVEPFFTKSEEQHLPFTQISDHYGVATELKVVDLAENY
ncbi:hypothetical protein IWQ60_002278 [Tieghemiomyces parasiticus]|uniref:sphingomyelin phosphodiesterase n=1 Tax=Tieghemiomyces parasiticus TaxID=78921 RepID=A0A9W8E171_9FUNG|nr:hypothetical protein IWQ60_002278 [Tieghemiomyces parasiticus]